MDKEIYKLPENQQGITEEDVRRIFNSMMSTLNTPAKMAGSYFQSANFVTGVAGWQLRADGAEINGGVNIQSLNIPDTTTASSFHVDSSGNVWWGANVATGYTGANAYILATGEAVFKNVQIGGTTIQYVITNSGIFSFGDGSDGNATCDGSASVTGMSRSGSTYTLTRDLYFNNLTINSGITVKPDGYRIFIKDTLSVSGAIDGNGNAGGAGGAGTNGIWNTSGTVAGGSAGTAGAALADGYLKGSLAGVAGQVGGVGGSANAAVAGVTGGNGSNTTNSLGSSATNGGAGGAGGNSSTANPGRAGGSGGSGGTVTLSNVKLIANWHLATLLDVSSSGSTVKFNNSASAGAGGSGGGGAGNGTGGPTSGIGGAGGGSGGSGTAGRIQAIYSRTITVAVGGSITANGGAGGAGGAGGNGITTGSDSSGNGGGGAGGAGGNGGILILAYNSLTNGGTISANAGVGGTGGAAGTGGVNGVAGSNGQDGAAGVIYQFQLSL